MCRMTEARAHPGLCADSRGSSVRNSRTAQPHGKGTPCDALLLGIRKEWALTHRAEWENPSVVLLSERNQVKRVCTIGLYLYKILERQLDPGDRRGPVVGWGRSLGRWMSHLLDCGDGFTDLYVYQKLTKIVYFKYV